jgi:hypothetical protein
VQLHSGIRSARPDAVWLIKALNELERSAGKHAIITMCCGCGLGTGI